VLDLALGLAIGGMTLLAPSSTAELAVMLRTALDLEGPVMIRYPKGAARVVPDDQVGVGLRARRVLEGDGEVCLLAIGKMVEAAEDAAVLLATEGIRASVWDVRVVRPLDPVMIADAARHRLIVTIEDGIRIGGAGAFIAQSIADLQESRQSPAVLVLGTPTAYIPHGKPAAIHAQLGLDGAGVAASVLKARHGFNAALTD
jgi:1-deoxy-D-xylulose-5-phosphate synthase